MTSENWLLLSMLLPLWIWMLVDIHKANQQLKAYKGYAKLLRKQNFAKWREKNT